jgi:hypothetical protein
MKGNRAEVIGDAKVAPTPPPVQARSRGRIWTAAGRTLGGTTGPTAPNGYTPTSPPPARSDPVYAQAMAKIAERRTRT